MTDKGNEQAVQAQARAALHGYGRVQVSAERFVIVIFSGSSAMGTKRGWRGRVGYRTLTRPLGWKEADEVVNLLDLAAEAKGGKGVYDEAYGIERGPWGPRWKS